MIQDNTVSILGWVQMEKVKWLQNNNPEVPSLVYKLAPLEKMRKLVHVRKLWGSILEIHPVVDVFGNQPIQEDSYDVDQYIEWMESINYMKPVTGIICILSGQIGNYTAKGTQRKNSFIYWKRI